MVSAACRIRSSTSAALSASRTSSRADWSRAIVCLSFRENHCEWSRRPSHDGPAQHAQARRSPRAFDCLAGAAVLGAQPQVCGLVASDPVVSRLITALAADAPRALRAVRKARSVARQRAWALAGDSAPGGDGSLIPADIDATIVIAHS